MTPSKCSAFCEANLRFLDFVPTAASRHREEEQACHEQSAGEAIHLCQIYVRFVPPPKKKLPEIIKHAKPFDEKYRFTDIKEGIQTKNRYVELIKLRYTFNSQKLAYMNFTIELTIGKKKNGKNVQYSLENIKKACS